MKRQYRAMERSGKYEIEEKIGRGDWSPVCEVDSLNKAISTIRTLKTLDEEDKDE